MSLLGIDIGTTGARVIILNEDGEISANKTVEYPTGSPRALWSEQDPDDWWKAACGAIKGALRSAGIAAGGIYGLW